MATRDVSIRISVMDGDKARQEFVLTGEEGQKALEKIKFAQPESLDPTKKKDSSQRFVGLRSFYHLVSTNPDKKTKGPMGAAFITRNPLLPDELFVAKGLDPFVVEMNKDLAYSLLKCPGRYSVRFFAIPLRR